MGSWSAFWFWGLDDVEYGIGVLCKGRAWISGSRGCLRCVGRDGGGFGGLWVGLG